MDFDFEVVFRNMPEMNAIRRHLEKEAERLDQKFEGIEGCHVDFNLPYHHRYPGNIYDIRIEVTVPGHCVKVNRGPSAEGSSADVFALINEAFEEASKKLDACASSKGPGKGPSKLIRKEISRRPPSDLQM